MARFHAAGTLWWLKFYGFIYKHSYKLKKRKIEKLQGLLQKGYESHLIDLDPNCSFLHDIEEFAQTLPEDTQILGYLMTLEATQDSSSGSEDLNCSNGSINAIGQDTEPDSGRLKDRFVSKNVVNLSSVGGGGGVNGYEISLLSNGLNFVPTPLSIDTAILKEDLERFGRNLRLKRHFRDRVQGLLSNPFKAKSVRI